MFIDEFCQSVTKEINILIYEYRLGAAEQWIGFLKNIDDKPERPELLKKRLEVARQHVQSSSYIPSKESAIQPDVSTVKSVMTKAAQSLKSTDLSWKMAFDEFDRLASEADPEYAGTTHWMMRAYLKDLYNAPGGITPRQRNLIRQVGKVVAPDDRQFNPIRRPPDPCKKSYTAKGSLSQYQCRDVLGPRLFGPALVVVPKTRTLQAYAITSTEISIKDFNQYCRQTTDCQVRKDSETLPVTDISLAQALGYARWLSEKTGYQYSLPTLAQWQHAVKADGVALLPDFNCLIQKNGKMIRGGALRAVNLGQQNSWGLYNSYGNAAEWVYIDGQLMAAGGDYNTPIQSCRIDFTEPQSGLPNPAVGFRLIRQLRH